MGQRQNLEEHHKKDLRKMKWNFGILKIEIVKIETSLQGRIQEFILKGQPKFSNQKVKGEARIKGAKRPRIEGEARVKGAKRLRIKCKARTEGEAQEKTGEGSGEWLGEQKLFSCLVCKKTFVNRLRALAPCGPPLDPPLRPFQMWRRLGDGIIST